MGIVLKIIDEDYVTEYKNPRVIIDKDLLFIIAKAEELGLHCLAYADVVGDTFYNEKQMLQIKKELEILKKQPGINMQAIEILEQTLNVGLEDSFLYLKFEGE